MKKLRLLWLLIPVAILITIAVSFGTYIYVRAKPPAPKMLDVAQQAYFDSMMQESYSEELTQPLPYPIKPAKLFIYAKAGIIIDASNGCILFEKNADMQIPPASMTKIAVMYVIFKAIEQNETTLDTVVDLVPQSWASKAPLQSSVMGLEKDQIVTVHELLLGLSVASGNDAATALAYHISGSVENFCSRMNDEMKELGLQYTRFVDASGYSELNMTTPKEFASLARAYIQKYTDALKTYHSADMLVFPQKHNYPKNYTGKYTTHTMYATNTLLNIVDGCDGLKTGFIYESGYNISLTAKRGDTRFISVTMGGPGIGTAEGNRYRVADGKKLLNWAFSSFETFLPQKQILIPVTIWQGTENALNLIEAQSHTLTVPNITEHAASKVTRKTFVNDRITAPVTAGMQLGTVQYSIDGVILEEIPLIADRTVQQGNGLKKLADAVAIRIIEKEKK